MKHNGFSLTEVLMAVGILSVGMMLIATMFPVGIYLTTVATERTMAAIVANEAFAKIQLYGVVDPNHDPCSCFDYEEGLVSTGKIDPNEFSYPSVDPDMGFRQYYWSALCKKLSVNPSDTEYLVTVFVARKTSPNLTYLDGGDSGTRPKAAKIDAHTGSKTNELETLSGKEKYVNPPTTILDNASGRLYRVVSREVAAVVKLDRDWDKDTDPPQYIWVVPPSETGGKNADVEVYQRIIRF